MREFYRQHKRFFRRVSLSVGAILLLFASTGLTVTTKTEVDCLYQTVDRAWDNWAHWKSVQEEIMRRQIEAITRIEIARAKREGRSYCPEGKRFEWTYDSISSLVKEQWKGFWESGTESKRRQLVYPIVAYAVSANWYTHEWPKEFACAVPEYKATRMRVPPWLYDRSRSYTEVGEIGNLTVYCRVDQEIAKSQ